MISVIIPTLNEETGIRNTLNHVMEQKGYFEIIVADGGSTDKTLEIVQTFPEVKITQAPKGRATQMNEGARHAQGSILLFLHADTLLLKNSLEKIENAMADEENVGGSFFLKFNINHPVYNFYSHCSKINHLLFTYGDQAIFIRSKIFKKVNGYKEIALMEDVEIQKRLRRTGKFVKLNHPVITSARRFARKGIILQQFYNIILVSLFLIGINPSTLKKYYKDEKSS